MSYNNLVKRASKLEKLLSFFRKRKALPAISNNQLPELLGKARSTSLGRNTQQLLERLSQNKSNFMLGKRPSPFMKYRYK